MRILLITPGSGGDYYCENCLRDGGMVRAVRAVGHDMSIVPLYLPLRTEQAPGAGEGLADDTPIFFGGVNVYLQQKWRLFRNTPRWLDSLFDARWLLRRIARKTGMTRPDFLGETTMSMLRGGRGRQSKELTRLVTWLKQRDRPDVICLSNALLAGLVPRIKAELNVPVVCMLQDEDGFLDSLGEAYSQDAWALLRKRLRQVDAFLPVSSYYAEAMIARLDLPARKVHVMHPGIESLLYAPPEIQAQPPAIGFLSQMSQSKGMASLAEAFIQLKSLPQHKALKLRLAGGATEGDTRHVDEVLELLTAAGLKADVEVIYHLDAEEKLQLLQSLSVICVPTVRGEAWGQFALEAMACGVPAVLPAHGGFVEMIKATGGGLLFEPNNASELAAALGQILDDGQMAAQLGRAGRQAVAAEFTLEKMASSALDVFNAVVTGA